MAPIVNPKNNYTRLHHLYKLYTSVGIGLHGESDVHTDARAAARHGDQTCTHMRAQGSQFEFRPDRLGAHPASYSIGTRGSFLGGKSGQVNPTRVHNYALI
jgi:hypothetical protein